MVTIDLMSSLITQRRRGRLNTKLKSHSWSSRKPLFGTWTYSSSGMKRRSMPAQWTTSSRCYASRIYVHVYHVSIARSSRYGSSRFGSRSRTRHRDGSIYF